jgi:hypothetical protein
MRRQPRFDAAPVWEIDARCARGEFQFKGSQMPVLKFLCPTTRAYADSGIRLDERSAAASRLTIVRVRCAQCRRQHRFLLADGVLDSSDTLLKKPAAKGRYANSTIAVHDMPGLQRRDFGAAMWCEKHMSP